jgi:chaperonin GroES
MMENTSGYWPIEDRVLVKPVLMEEKTAGGIVLAQDTKATENMASMHGHIVAAGEEGTARMQLHKIGMGDLVLYAKYAGQVFKGKDGETYRIMNAADVIARAEGAFGDTFKARIPIRPAA